MKKILLISFLCGSFICFSQNYSYGFEGDLSNIDWKTVERQLTSIPGLKEFKIRLKEESSRGEILLYVIKKEDTGEEQRSEFSPTEIKKLLIEAGLQPLAFKALKTN